MKTGSAVCKSYGNEEVFEAVKKAVKCAGGFPDLSGKKVLIKPNLLSDAGYDTATTTHPEVVYAVSKLVLDAGGTLVIADSPGAGLLYTERTMKKLYEKGGILDVCDRLGINPSYDLGSSEVSFPAGEKMKRFTIIQPAMEADVIISVCKLKTHMFTQFSGAVKNTFGVIPGHGKSVFHSRFPDGRDFSRMLIDLNECMKPDFVVMDAVIGMEGNGPMGGSPKFAGYIFASASPYALDITAQELIGMEPDRIGTTVAAKERGLVDEILVSGDPVISIPDYVFPSTYHGPENHSSIWQRIFWKFMSVGNMYAPYPVVSKEKCTACGQCVRICPEKAAVMKGGVAHFNLHECIRCYCCHEMCQFEAVDLKMGFFAKVLRRIL